MIKSSILVTSLSLLLSVMGFISQMLTAKFFGAGHVMDIYFSLSSLPILLSSVFASALSYFLIPTLIEAKHVLDKNYGIFLGQLFGRLMFLIVLTAIIGYFLMGTFCLQIYSSIRLEDIRVAKIIIFFSWSTVPFSVISGFISCQFNAKKNFIAPLLLSFSPYLFSIIIVIFFQQSSGILTLPIGLFFGTCVAAIIGAGLLFRDFSFKESNKETNLIIMNFLKKLPIATIAMLCFTIYQSIDAYWVTKLGSANLSYLSYCQRLLIAVGALIIIGPSTILIPRLTESIISEREDLFEKDVDLVIKIVFSLGTMVAVIGSIFAYEIIKVLFVRGKFSIDDAQHVANILPYMLIGMIFMLLVVVMFRILFVKREINFVAAMGITAVCLYFIFSALAVHFNSLEGICIGYVTTWFVLFVFSLKKIFKNNLAKVTNCIGFLFLVKNLSILLITAFVLYFLKFFLLQHLHFSDFSNALITLVIGGGIGLTLSIILSILFKQKEITFLTQAIFELVYRRVRKPL